MRVDDSDRCIHHPPPSIEEQQHLLMAGEEDGAGAGHGNVDGNYAPLLPLPLDSMLGPMGLDTPHPIGGLPKHVRVPGFLTTSAFLQSLPALPGGGFDVRVLFCYAIVLPFFSCL